ncbi:CocE/NonD family hydrolase [Actinoplanes sp. NPDC089786]|uniref:CocE/NonD family hydrolase n=1 Tax=Actinoplanes sp. NPDC089786 TaxID=3155185 RepID=UPI003436012A
MARLLDRLATRLLKLPPATTGYTVTKDLRVPMRDGVTLAADLFRPVAEAAGTILIRGPYGRGMFAAGAAGVYAARGYAVLYVSSRGTFGSGGVFDPMITEADDGQDVVRWMVAQPWFTGRFATLGISYLGFTQWALMADPPPQLAAAIVTVGPHDFARHMWGTGALNLDFLGWADLVAHQEDPGVLRRVYRQATAAKRLGPVLAGLPVADAGERYLAGRAPWYRDRVTRPDLADPFWAPMRQAAALERADVPILIAAGWQDLFLEQSIEQYTRLRDRGVDVALTVGPWSHTQVAGQGAGLITRETLDWLGEHLAGHGRRRRRTPVRVFVTGAGEWRDLPSWPPAERERTFFLNVNGELTAERAGEAATAAFTFDPARPTPVSGGPVLSGGGVVDDSALAGRDDVLAFTSAPLTEPLTVLGAPVLTLAHSSDNPHVDVFARLSDVGARARSRNVTEGYLRLDPERGDGPVTLRLRNVAHRFAAGSRVRLLISGGAHPQYARNLGTGENPGTGSAMRPATHAIALRTSSIVLPQVEPEG